MGDRQKMRAAWRMLTDAVDALTEDGNVEGFALTYDTIRDMVGHGEDAPPPADVSRLALANRTLHADLEAARADVERVTAERNHFARVLLAAADASGRESCVDMVMAMESATGTMGCRELAAELRRLCGVPHA